MMKGSRFSEEQIIWRSKDH